MKTNWRTLWQQQSIVVYRDEVEFDLLEAAEHHDVLEDAGGRLAADPDEFEAVPMEV